MKQVRRNCIGLISLAISLAAACPAAAQVLPKISAGVSQKTGQKALSAAVRPQTAWKHVLQVGASASVKGAAAAVFKQPSSKPSATMKIRPDSPQNPFSWAKESLQKRFGPFQPVRIGSEWFTSRKALKQAVDESYQKVIRFQQEHFPQLEDVLIQRIIYQPFKQVTPLTLTLNKEILYANQNLLERMNWLKRWPDKGRQELRAFYARQAFSFLVRQVQHQKMLLIGERHDSPHVQQRLGDLLLEIKRAYPARRVVLFSEFLDLPPVARPDGAALPRYYRRVSEETLPTFQPEQLAEDRYGEKVFARLSKAGVDVYPLEDPVQNKIFETELEEKQQLCLFTISSRNKTWVRVIESKMAEIRKTDPDALFVVYAGIGHTSWMVPQSLPKFFANEQPVVVEMSDNSLSRYNLLHPVWGREDAVFRLRETTTLLYWNGQYARQLAKQTGFDYALIFTGK